MSQNLLSTAAVIGTSKIKYEAHFTELVILANLLLVRHTIVYELLVKIEIKEELFKFCCTPPPHPRYLTNRFLIEYLKSFFENHVGLLLKMPTHQYPHWFCMHAASESVVID